MFIPTHFLIRTFVELKDKEIELALLKAREQEARQFKIIILGAGECGKSTILKQLRMIFTVSCLTGNVIVATSLERFYHIEI